MSVQLAAEAKKEEGASWVLLLTRSPPDHTRGDAWDQARSFSMIFMLAMSPRRALRRRSKLCREGGLKAGWSSQVYKTLGSARACRSRQYASCMCRCRSLLPMTLKASVLSEIDRLVDPHLTSNGWSQKGGKLWSDWVEVWDSFEYWRHYPMIMADDLELCMVQLKAQVFCLPLHYLQALCNVFYWSPQSAII